MRSHGFPPFKRQPCRTDPLPTNLLTFDPLPPPETANPQAATAHAPPPPPLLMMAALLVVPPRFPARGTARAAQLQGSCGSCCKGQSLPVPGSCSAHPRWAQCHTCRTARLCAPCRQGPAPCAASRLRQRGQAAGKGVGGPAWTGQVDAGWVVQACGLGDVELQQAMWYIHALEEIYLITESFGSNQQQHHHAALTSRSAPGPCKVRASGGMCYTAIIKHPCLTLRSFAVPSQNAGEQCMPVHACGGI